MIKDPWDCCEFCGQFICDCYKEQQKQDQQMTPKGFQELCWAAANKEDSSIAELIKYATSMRDQLQLKKMELQDILRVNDLRLEEREKEFKDHIFRYSEGYLREIYSFRRQLEEAKKK